MKLTHDFIERNIGWMIGLTILVVSVGGLVEIVPLFFQKSTTQPVAGLKPYDPLQLTGRDIYIREGCYNCHSQMVRPMRDEIERYGHFSLAAESKFDHPFQWGSKRTGPDLARVGAKYSDDWHVTHLTNPRAIVPQSVMPGYPYLARTEVDETTMAAHLRTSRTVGVPYSDDQIANAEAYRNIVVAYRNGAPIVLKDVAEVIEGLENSRVGGWYHGEPAVIVDVQRQPGAEFLTSSVGFTMTVSADYTTPIDPDEVRGSVQGLAPAEAAATLKSRWLLAGEPDIYLDPAWKGTLPDIGSRIQVRVDYGEQ